MEESAQNIPVTPKPNPFTTVTPLSKALALILFIALPFLGFYLGAKYQEMVTVPNTVLGPVIRKDLAAKNTLDRPQSPSSTEELVYAYNPESKQAETQAFKTEAWYKLFTESEVQQIKRDLIDPFFDYYNEKNIGMVAYIITKPGLSSQAISSNGGGEWSHAATYKESYYWVPSCMGPCDFTATFKNKHPKTVELGRCLEKYPPDSNSCFDLYFAK